MNPTRFAVVGTAGHIDHGKTALVRLLTGVDTDRLKEEKERGISIDLGFAHLPLPGGIDCGIVDVPGHERFVRNMLAGVGGIDAVLLVIAADEGVMPQTREHFDIVRLLGVERGVVALTRIDLVEPDWLPIVVEEVGDYLKGTPFAGAPLVPVSSRTGEGRDDLMAALARVLADLPEPPVGAPARLPVDRVFVVEGFGTVVTGTLWQGTVRSGDRVVVEPGAIETRVRSVQVHGREVEEAHAGQRTALALHGIEKSRLSRGFWVLSPGALIPSHMIDARVELLPGTPKPLANRRRIRFHLGASEVLGRVILLDREELAPGDSAVAQIRLEAPVVADRGDRFVLRSYSPQRAIGGGTVLLPNPKKHRRGDAEAVARIELEEGGGLDARLRQALKTHPFGAREDELARVAGLGGHETATGLLQLQNAGEARRLDDGRWLAEPALGDLSEQALAACRRYQEGGSFRWGLGRGELKSHLPRQVDAVLFEAVTAALESGGSLFRRGDRFRADTPDLVLSPGDRALVERALAAFAGNPFFPPTVREMEESLRMGPRLAEVLSHLAVAGMLVKINSDIYYRADTLRDMEDRIGDYFRTQPEMRVADLKELFGMSRRHAVPVLEYFDRTGITRRMGDVRVAGRVLTRPE